MMRNLLTLILLLTQISLFGQSKESLTDSLIDVFNGRNCEVEFMIVRAYSDHEYTCSKILIPSLEPTENLFFAKNKSRLDKILLAFLKGEKYDWISCLILYYIFGEDGTHLNKYSYDCLKWRKRRKKREIEFWVNKLSE